MNKKDWEKLSSEEQNLLAAKYGITRSGLNNAGVKDEELLKIPEVKKDVKKVSTKKAVKSVAKKTVKRSNRAGVVAKPQSRRKK